MKKLVLKKTSFDAASGKSAKVYKINYAEELNEAQLDAVMHDTGAALVVAGAGTGKTRTLVYRVARLIEDGIEPASILLLTFTRKSAAEMLRRATQLLDGRCEAVSGGTFHSFAHGYLRRLPKHLTALGLDNNFTVLDQSDAEDVVNLLRSQLVGNDKKRRFPRKNTLFAMFSAEANCRKALEIIIHDDYPQFEEDTPAIKQLRDFYVAYKRKHNLVDYDDLLVLFLELLRTNADLRRDVQKQYRYIMVDEYQDTNQLQHELVLCLAAIHENIMAVGDDAQSIYSFRGANYENIMRFPDSFRHCRLIKLEENFRSTQPILSLTNEIIRRALYRYDKELYSRKSGSTFPMVIQCDKEAQQSQFIVQQILEYREEGLPLDDIAVLVRSGFHSFDLEVELNRANIPYQKFGGFKFVETSHIKDIIAHLRVLVNPKDAVSWNRILLLLEGVGPKTALKVIDAIVAGNVTLETAHNLGEIARGDEQIRRLFNLLARLNTEKLTPSEQTWQIIDHYRPQMKRKYDDYKKRTKDIETFGGITERYRSINALLADMAIEPPVESVEDIAATGSEDEFLTISTIHSAKGLEWGVVFVIWTLDGRFPPVRAFDTEESLEEERRLFYVACTRAKERLFLTYPINIFDRETGMVLGKVTRFLDGLPEELTEKYLLADEE